MKSAARPVAAMAALLAALFAAPINAAEAPVTSAAVWGPPPGFLAHFHRLCDGRSGNAFTSCFAAAMGKAGASPQAIAFTRRLDNEAYLQTLDESGGPIAVAHVVFPFAANENNGWFLINGTPAQINVDNFRNLDLARMRSSAAYLTIHDNYRNASFWPGDRGANGPEVMNDGRKFIVGYLLRDLCHACAVIGRVRYAFDFDQTGKFLGTRLVSVTPVDKPRG